MRKVKCLYIAGTRQNEGKTTFALGLIGELISRGLRVGYIKPVGQQYVEVEGFKVDKDSLLIVRVFNLEGCLADTSPIAVDRNFTRNYIDNPNPEKLERSIVESYERIALGKDIVVIEGTGHAGVGTVIDLSNARVAKLLGAPVVIISSGGIGRPIDEFCLNRAVFEKEGVPIAGVLVNKITEDKMVMVRSYLEKGLARQSLQLFGVLPEAKQLSRLTLRQVVKDTGATVLHGSQMLDNTVDRFLVGAMTAHEALNCMGPGVLMITGGDRDDLILAAMGSCFGKTAAADVVVGMILTGGLSPHGPILELLSNACFAVLLHEHDSYSVATQIHDLVAKIQIEDKAKHSLAMKMVHEHVDVDRILATI